MSILRRVLGRLEMPARSGAGPFVRRLCDSVGLPTRPAQRARLLESLGIAVVADVGANIGQYAAQLRLYGYGGEIVSFEPYSAAYAALSARAASDAAWRVERTAVGRASGRALLHVAANSQSSSLLPMHARHLQSAPTSSIVGDEDVAVDTLDRLLTQVGPGPLYLKIDAQGAEAEILDGSPATLARAVGLELEVSLTTLYEGEALVGELLERAAAAGFALVGLFPGHSDIRSGEILQVDALFRRG